MRERTITTYHNTVRWMKHAKSLPREDVLAQEAIVQVLPLIGRGVWWVMFWPISERNHSKQIRKDWSQYFCATNHGKHSAQSSPYWNYKWFLRRSFPLFIPAARFYKVLIGSMLPRSLLWLAAFLILYRNVISLCFLKKNSMNETTVTELSSEFPPLDYGFH